MDLDRTVRRRAHPLRRTTDPPARARTQHRLLELQASAGNRAVSGLLAVHRDPTPDATSIQATPATLIAEAKVAVHRGDIDDAAFEHYRTAKAGTVAEVAGLLWLDELALVEVDPTGAGIPSRADQKAVRDFNTLLQARVGKA